VKHKGYTEAKEGWRNGRNLEFVVGKSLRKYPVGRQEDKNVTINIKKNTLREYDVDGTGS
jgi:hypothetical protein